ncbi:MAG: response regulator transcription factor [Peptostreptococcaceae bacterium]|nr:response regulator transcription factor [Peptostreptococcaceae bacterium]
MTIKIGICDDNLEDSKILREALISYEPSLQISSFTNGESLLLECSDNRCLFDIIFLDIYMPGLNGIETAAKIRDIMKDTKIIFTSSSKDHYSDAFDVFAYNYLVKPIQAEKLNRVIEEAIAAIGLERRQQICFSYKGGAYRIFCRDVLYIESDDKIIFFHMVDKTLLQTYGKLDEILDQLPNELFARCHQSFIVNIHHISEMSENHFRVGSAVVGISRKYLKEAKEKYFSYLFTNMNRG